MSIKVQSLVWEHYPEGGSKLLLLLALADFADDNGGNVYPSIETMCAKIRMSERTVQYLLKELVNDGVLHVTANARGGRGKSTNYTIDLETLQSLHPLKAAKIAPNTEKGCKKPQKRVQTTTEKGAIAVAPEPSKNHQVTINNSSTDVEGVSPKQYVFDIGLSLLVNAGQTEKQARTFLGMKLKSYSPEQMQEAIDATIASDTGDPVPYLVKTLQGMAKRQAQPKQVARPVYGRPVHDFRGRG